MGSALIASIGFCLLYGLQIVLQSLYLRTAIHPLQLMFLTNAASFLILTGIHAVGNRQIFHVVMPKQVFVIFILSTLLWIVADMSTIVGLTVSSSVNLSILSRLQLFITYIGAVLFLKEALLRRKIAALVLAFIGSILTVYRGQSIVFNMGDVLFLVFAFAISISGLLRQKISVSMPVHELTYYMFGVSALIMGVIVAVVAPLSALPIPGFILLNAVLGLSGFTLVNYAIAKGGAAQFSLVSSLLPFATAVFAFLLLKELPTVYQVLGGLIIVTGIILFIGKAKHA